MQAFHYFSCMGGFEFWRFARVEFCVIGVVVVQLHYVCGLYLIAS